MLCASPIGCSGPHVVELVDALDRAGDALDGRDRGGAVALDRVDAPLHVLGRGRGATQLATPEHPVGELVADGGW